MSHSSGSVAGKLEKRRIDQFEVEDAARTLIRAEKIRQDKTMMKLVDKEIAKQKKALESVLKKS